MADFPVCPSFERTGFLFPPLFRVPFKPEDSAAKSFLQTFSPIHFQNRKIVPHNPSVTSLLTGDSSLYAREPFRLPTRVPSLPSKFQFLGQKPPRLPIFRQAWGLCYWDCISGDAFCCFSISNFSARYLPFS